MRTKLLCIAMIVVIVMISACVNPGGKWVKDETNDANSTNSVWEQNQVKTRDQKKPSNAYRYDESPY